MMRPFRMGWRGTLVLRVEFDDQVRFHDDRVRYVGQARLAYVCRFHLAVVSVDVVRNVTLCQLSCFQQNGHLLGLLANFDHVTFFNTVGRDVDALAVHQDVAVVYELTSSENCRNELGAVNNGVQTTLEQTNQVFTCVTLDTFRVREDATELFFGQVAVVTLQLLLGAQLDTEVGQLALTTLAVLAGAVFTTVNGGFRTTPDVFTRSATVIIPNSPPTAARARIAT